MRLWIVNPGSTSTKTALYQGGRCLAEETVRHPSDQLLAMDSLMEQEQLRTDAVEAALSRALEAHPPPHADDGAPSPPLQAVVARGGLVHPVPSGVYRVNDAMLADLAAARYGVHASNLGAPIAHRIAARLGIPALVVDPPVVDEMIPEARYAGHPLFHRRSAFHALNHKAVARKAARDIGRPYGTLNLVVAHLGGGISVAAHRRGRVVDVNNALEEGPFSPERSGTLPSMQLLDLCFSGRYGREEIRRMLVGAGGLFAYLGTTDGRLIEERVAIGDPAAAEAMSAMVFQIAKEIGASATVLDGQVDAILLTGGLARNRGLVEAIRWKVSFLAPVRVYPGEAEMEALAEGASLALSGRLPLLEYETEAMA